MISKNNRSNIFYFSVTILLTYGMVLLSVAVPIVSVVLWVLLPLPTTLYAARYGAKKGVLGALTIGAVSALGAFYGFMPHLAIWAGATGLCLSVLLEKKVPTIRVVITMATLYFILFVSTIVYYNWVYQADIIQNLIDTVQHFLNMAALLLNELLATGAQDGAEQMRLLETVLKELPKVIGENLSSYLIIISMVFGYLYYGIAKKLVRYSGVSVTHLKPFYHFRIQKRALLFVVLVWIFQGIGSEYIAEVIMNNIIQVIMFLVAISGLAVMDWQLKKVGVIAILRVLIGIGVFILSAFVPLIDFWQILIIVGVLDAFLNFRKIRRGGYMA